MIRKNTASRFITPCLISLLCGIITGCGPTGKIIKSTKPISKLSSYSFLIVEVTSETEKCKESIMEQLEGSIVNQLREMKIFDRVFSKRMTLEKTFDAKIFVTVTRFRGVSNTARALLGLLAGKASITAKVQFMDLGTEKILTDAVIVGKSGGLAYSGGTSQGTERLAQQVAKFVRNSLIK